jgi:parallel beta-helix repeat protein
MTQEETMTRRSLALSIVLGTLVTTLWLATPASAQVIVVPPGESIHQAVKAAQPGATIQLAAGVYEDVVVVKTNGITIQGVGSGPEGTILRPPADLPGRCFRGVGGICIFGDFRGEGTPVEDVTITGIRAEGFADAGFISILSRGTTFDDNAAVGGGGYGLAAFESPGITMRNNVASGNGFAGLYVGDTRRANATIEGNEGFDNVFGMFLRDASRGTVAANSLHDNCIGILVLETRSPVRAGRFTMVDNTIRHNNEFCRGGGGQPSTSGTGIAIAGGRGNTIEGNVIARNRPSRDVPFHGGVALFELDGAEPVDNTVTGNTLTRNRPNVFTDGSGSGNVIEGNVCTPDC